MSVRVFVTGAGIISGLGHGLPETIRALFQSLSGIGKIRFIETSLKEELAVSEVQFSHEELFGLAGIPVAEGYSRNALLGLIAAQECARYADYRPDPQRQTGLISATTVGGMDRCEMYYEDFLTNDLRNDYIDSYDCADSTEKIADLLGISDYLTTISTACSSSANAILLGARMIRAGQLDRVVAGGCESLTKFHLNGFNALKILDKDLCKPFDARRNGINLGEGAAYLMLESEESARTGGRTVMAEVVGWGNACEAFHQTASSPDGEGAFLAMQKALAMSGLEPGEIGYINAHGTGTDNNDLSEGIAIQRLFGEALPAISSTKPMTGHTTSAAGATEAILAILSLQHGILWPNLNFSDKMEELSFIPVLVQTPRPGLKAVMSNSFGFGGNDTSLIFKKISN